MPGEDIVRFRDWVSDQVKDDYLLKKYEDKLLALLSNYALLKELKRRYRELPQERKDLNLTSLVLWHGPLSPDPRKSQGSFNGLEVGYCCNYNAKSIPQMLRLNLCHRNTECLFLSSMSFEPKNGQLLTGDLNFNHRYYEFKHHFGGRLASTLLCVAPHHGSRKSWNRLLLQDIKPAKIWVVSAGIRKGSYPPHLEVIADIVGKGKILVWVSNNEDYIIRMTFN